jgi:hypothetical protein
LTETRAAAEQLAPPRSSSPPRKAQVAIKSESRRVSDPSGRWAPQNCVALSEQPEGFPARPVLTRAP